MNIFFLDSSPSQAAIYNVDSHVRKIILEAAQMLSSAYDSAPYRKTHVNHPMTRWCRESRGNFEWALAHGFALCREFTYRFGKTHKTLEVFNWYQNNPPRIEKSEFTPPPQCFGDYKDLCFTPNDPILGYRKYYNIAKKHLFAWKNREIPYFIKEYGTG